MQTKVQIKGMTCGHCARAVENALRKVPGVNDVQVTIGEAVISSEGPPDPEVVRQTIENAGYQLG
jgi:copper chaperone